MTEYTITGASDWNMLIAVGGLAAFFISGVVVVLVRVIWHTLPKKEDLDDIARRFSYDIMKIADRWEGSLDKACHFQSEKTAKEIEKMWKAMTDCQRECCPRRKSDKTIS